MNTTQTQPHQTAFPGLCPVEDALDLWSMAGSEARGAVFTRREVVDFILEVAGYTPVQPLHRMRLLEPSFGAGDFLLVAIERLLAAWRVHAPDSSPLDLSSCIRAVELHRDTLDATRPRVLVLLNQAGIAENAATQLANEWLVSGDFLLADLPGSFDFVVGNPPYVRQEQIPAALLAEYRVRYLTVFDRADLYIPFIERSLDLLAQGGALGFICADRWMKNRYGGPLRRKVAGGYRLKYYIDMTDTPAFHSEVSAYPAITVITREAPGPTRIAYRPQVQKDALDRLAGTLLAEHLGNGDELVQEIRSVGDESQPWMLHPSDRSVLVRRLENTFPTLEEAGCKVGIGVATGADDAFIGPFDDLDVEEDRKLPLVMTRDILSGEVTWRGLGVINPFADHGGLVDLSCYPRLASYLDARKTQIAARHVARKAPRNWYRTIDRIDPALARAPKLLVPDIKGDAHIVYEAGRLYPHHNLYYITARDWDLRALQAVLRSGIARLFVAAYSTRMRGGYLRFQAQYLRRIRLPIWPDVPSEIRQALITAAAMGDEVGANEATFELYGLSRAERIALSEAGEER